MTVRPLLYVIEVMNVGDTVLAAAKLSFSATGNQSIKLGWFQNNFYLVSAEFQGNGNCPQAVSNILVEARKAAKAIG
jgi:hypothetical protein